MVLRFSSVPVDTVGDVQGSVNLSCISEGYPVPNLSWVRNGERLSSSPGRRLITLSNITLNNSLPVAHSELILSLLELTDAGSYLCIAENDLAEHKNLSTSAQLQVYCE